MRYQKVDHRYSGLLKTLGDLSRLLGLVLDQDRQNRMRDLSGGDHAALTEITDLQDTLLNHADLDLAAMARLAVHRDALRQRNTNIHTGLPAVWATIGQPDRAEAAARSITDPDWQAQALAGIARALAGTDPDRARLLAEAAEAAARSITGSFQQTQALAGVSWIS